MGWFGQRFPRLKISVSIYHQPALRSPRGAEEGRTFSITGASVFSRRGAFTFEFQPLKAGETFGKLTLHNSRLGYYPYELNLRKPCQHCLKSPSTSRLFLAADGGIFAKFTNYTRQKTEYYCRVSPAPTLCPLLSRSLGSEREQDTGVQKYETPTQGLHLVENSQLETEYQKKYQV